MCELILPDIWLFLCNFFDKNDKKINSKTGCQRNRKLHLWFSINMDPKHKLDQVNVRSDLML